MVGASALGDACFAFDERFAGLYDVEGNRNHLQLNLVVLRADAGVAAGFQVPRLGKVLAEMRAAAVFACQRRNRDDLRDIDEAFQIEPVMPGQVVAPVSVLDAYAAQGLAVPGDGAVLMRDLPSATMPIGQAY